MGSRTVRLKAIDLMSKFGFDDGALLDDILEENGYDILAPRDGNEDLGRPFGASVLGECIRRYLVPGFPTPLQIDYDLSIAHNPARLRGWNEMDREQGKALFGEITMDLTESQVLEVAAELEPAYPTARQAIPSATT